MLYLPDTLNAASLWRIPGLTQTTAEIPPVLAGASTQARPVCQRPSSLLEAVGFGQQSQSKEEVGSRKIERSVFKAVAKFEQQLVRSLLLLLPVALLLPPGSKGQSSWIGLAQSLMKWWWWLAAAVWKVANLPPRGPVFSFRVRAVDLVPPQVRKESCAAPSLGSRLLYYQACNVLPKHSRILRHQHATLSVR